MLAVEETLRALLARGAEDGTLTPGSKIPTERDLVERLAAPRSAVRRPLHPQRLPGAAEHRRLLRHAL